MLAYNKQIRAMQKKQDDVNVSQQKKTVIEIDLDVGIRQKY